MRGLTRFMVFAAAAATPLSAIVALGVPQAQAQTKTAATATTGTIEVCKNAANGMAGKQFSFHVNGLQGRSNPVLVTGGTCSAPLTVTAGHQTINENAAGLPAGDTVSAIVVQPRTDQVSQTLSTRSVVVNVRAGSTAGNETVVRFTNKITPAQLKICKAVTASDLVGDPFTFTINGGAPFSVTAGTTSAPNCSGLTTYASGTVVNIAEQQQSGLHVASIALAPAGGGSNKNLAAGTFTVTLTPGIHVVTYTNAHTIPLATGLLEVCKQASDPYVSGSFVFTIKDAAGATQTQSVRVGQCTAPLTVAAGNATVTETQRSPYFLDDVYTVPSGDLVSQNDTNGSAVVKVVHSDTDETQVNFVNDTQTNEVKICKTLTANSAALAGQTFTFQVTSANGTYYEDVVAGSAGSTVCQPVTFGDNGPIQWLPIGSKVTITEESTPFVQNTSVVVAPAAQDLGSAPPTANLLVGGPSVITTATFTNQALSQLEVCKQVTAYAPTTGTFLFTISDNGTTTTVNVKANTCSSPITLPAGSATVTETQQTNFVLQSITVAGDGTLLSQSGTTATVSLPYAGDTAVTFTNTVATGSFKVCKAAASPNDAATFQLENATWNFNWSYTANGVANNGSATLAVGQCTLVQTGIPVMDQNGNPTQITVTEGLSPLISTLSGVTVTSGSATVDTTLQTATFGVAPTGIQVATFVNKAVLP